MASLQRRIAHAGDVRNNLTNFFYSWLKDWKMILIQWHIHLCFSDVRAKAPKILQSSNFRRKYSSEMKKKSCIRCTLSTKLLKLLCKIERRGVAVTHKLPCLWAATTFKWLREVAASELNTNHPKDSKLWAKLWIDLGLLEDLADLKRWVILPCFQVSYFNLSIIVV